MAGGLRNGGNWILAGAAGAVLVPVLAVGLALPFPIALLVAALAFAGIGVLTAPRRLFEGMDLGGVGSGRVALARKVLSEALPDLERLEDGAKAIRRRETGRRLAHLAATARTIVAGVEQNPDRLMNVQRVLTYYLPQAARLADSYALVEQRRLPDAERLAELDGMIGRLDEAFAHYADSLTDTDLKGLDADLRLLSASLESDIGRRT